MRETKENYLSNHIDLNLNGLSLNMIHDSTFSFNSQSRSYLIGKENAKQCPRGIG